MTDIYFYCSFCKKEVKAKKMEFFGNPTEERWMSFTCAKGHSRATNLDIVKKAEKTIL